jgi:hypothetical protein
MAHRSYDQGRYLPNRDDLRDEEWKWLTEELKLVNTCEDCLYVRNRLVTFETEKADQWECEHPKNILSRSLDIVSSNIIKVFKNKTCRDNREATGNEEECCGKEGRWFENYTEYLKERARLLKESMGETGNIPDWTAKDLADVSDVAAKRVAEAKLKKVKLGNLDNLKL